MLAARPVATSISSARSSAGSLPSGPTIRQMPLSSAVTDAASNRALVMTVMPRLVKLRSTSLLTSASSSGTIPGRYSSSVTLTPTSLYMLANSTPTAPAPTMTMSLGSVSILRMSSLVTIRLPSGVRPGSDFTREPVARMMSVALRVRSPPPPGVPSSAGWLTTTLPGPSRRPRPGTQVTLFLSISVLRPVHMRLTTASRRAAIAA